MISLDRKQVAVRLGDKLISSFVDFIGSGIVVQRSRRFSQIWRISEFLRIRWTR